MEKEFLVTKQKDYNVTKELLKIETRERDVEFFMWKQLVTGKTIYNKLLIDKEEFIEFAKKFLEEENES